MRMITSALISEATGASVENHGSLESLEVIFASDDSSEGEEDGLSRCRRLRCLSLIDCGIEKIETISLRCVSATLERLCLADQNLKSMVGLGSLPQLRWLYLQENQIEKMEDLGQCPRLRTLWLFDNRIRRLDGLGDLGELRELWVQSNKLKRLAGAEHATCAKQIFAAGNDLDDFRDLALLARLPCLRELSFDDAHFGACPIVSREGYRDAVVRALPRLSALDNVAVEEGDRAKAKDAHLQSVLDLQEKLDRVVMDHRRAAAEIESKRLGSVESARGFEAEMASNFEKLGTLVGEGRAKIAAEHARLRQAQSLAAKSLDASLTAALADHVSKSERAREAERHREIREDQMLCALERRARAERQAALVIGKLQGDDARPIGEHSPDFKWLRSRLDGQLSLATAYRLFGQPHSRSESNRKVWFYALSPLSTLEDLSRALLTNFENAAGPRQRQQLVLYASARQAIASTVGQRRSITPSSQWDLDKDDNKEDPLGILRDADALINGGDHRSRRQFLRQDDSRDKDAEAFGIDDENGDLALLVVCRTSNEDGKSRGDGERMSVPEGPLAKWGVEASHLLLVASKLVARDPRLVEADLESRDDYEKQERSRLAAFEKAVEDAVAKFTLCTEAELAPKEAQLLQNASDTLVKQEKKLLSHRADLEQQRLTQATIFKDLLHNTGSSNGSKH